MSEQTPWMDFGKVLQPGAERLADGLFAETDAQKWFWRRRNAGSAAAAAPLRGGCPTGREHDAVVAATSSSARCCRCGAHIDFEPQFEQHVPQVVGGTNRNYRKADISWLRFLRLIDQFPGLADGPCPARRACSTPPAIRVRGRSSRRCPALALIVRGVLFAADELADGDEAWLRSPSSPMKPMHRRRRRGCRARSPEMSRMAQSWGAPPAFRPEGVI